MDTHLWNNLGMIPLVCYPALSVKYLKEGMHIAHSDILCVLSYFPLRKSSLNHHVYAYSYLSTNDGFWSQLGYTIFLCN